MLPFYFEVARTAFRRQLIYRWANLAGLFTNIFFGSIFSYVIIALFHARPSVGEYDVQDTLRYTWLVQSMIMVVMTFGWYDLMLTIRSGTVISDLSKPCDFYWYWFSREFGRAVYYLFYRGVPTYVAGMLLFGFGAPLDWRSWLIFLVSLTLGTAIGIAYRVLYNTVAFWFLEARGMGTLFVVIALFFTGSYVPLPFFPQWLLSIAGWLPFNGLINLPTEILLGKLAGSALLFELARQVLWVIGLTWFVRLIIASATRRVVEPVTKERTVMLGNILSDMRLYWHLVMIQIRAQVQYKVNLAVDIGTYFAVTSLEFSAVLIYFGSFPTLLGWKVGEVALLAGVMSVSFGLAEMFGAGIDAFPETIRLGEFDRVLLRPNSAFMLVTGSDFRLRRLGRITQGCITVILALHLLPDLHWTLAKVVALLIGIGSGSILFMSVLLLQATLCFWTVETTELVNILTYGGREMLSYPLTIYSQLMQRFFLFIVPLAFGSFVPTCYLLGRPLPFGLPDIVVFAAPVVALVFALVAGGIWDFGVRHYQSTGS